MKRSLLAIALSASICISTSLPAQAISATWGLDRVGYTASTPSAAGVRVYVLDTGIALDPGFGNRVSGDLGDCNGHGTHVAGIIGSSEFGVARSVKLISIKVANCSGGVTSTDLIAGIDRVIAMNPKGQPAVVNMSITLGKDKNVDAAINRLIASGLLPVVAAGNYTADACSYSPANVPGALTVAGINVNGQRTTDSNWGPCVDLFAPGGLITSEDAFNTSGSAVKIGTSMAAGFVSGAAAIYMSGGYTAAETTTALLNGAISGVINPLNSPDKLLKLIIPAPVVAPVKATYLGVSGMVLSWRGTDGLSYRIDRSNDGKTWALYGSSVSKSIKLTSFGYYRIVIDNLVSSVIKVG